MKLYSIDVNICGTAYIKADSPEEAAEEVRKLQGDFLEVDGGMIDGRPYSVIEDKVTFSPMMTIGKQACPLIEEAHDYEDE